MLQLLGMQVIAAPTSQPRQCAHEGIRASTDAYETHGSRGIVLPDSNKVLTGITEAGPVSAMFPNTWLLDLQQARL